MLGILLKFLPRNHLSYWVGKLMHVPLPTVFKNFAIRKFGEIYNISFDEAEKPYTEYRSIGDFFVRRLKPGLRPLESSPILHPADSVISQIGAIENSRCVQAKNKSYSIHELIQDPALSKKVEGGLFATYYLCPTDYHRVHSPVDGTIKSVIHIPGTLWPVNDWSARTIDDLFSINERVVVEIESRLGVAVVVFVGATNVGKITLSFDSEIVSNQLETKGPRRKEYTNGIQIKKGDELGMFHMGSTIVMLYPKTILNQRSDWDVFRGRPVKMGQALL